jgi:hypothetical protein
MHAARLITFVAAFVAPLTAAAQPTPYVPTQPGPYPAAPAAPATPSGIERAGFVIGLGIGPGGMQDADCEECIPPGGAAFAFHIGGMVQPKMAVIVELAVNAVGEENDGFGRRSWSQVLWTVAARYFASDRIWIQAGAGAGKLEKRFEGSTLQEQDEEIEADVAFVAAIGVEIYQGRRFALDAQLRGALASYGGDVGMTPFEITSSGILVGLNWY